MRLSQLAPIAIALAVAIVAVIVVPGRSGAPSRAVSRSETVARATFKGSWPFRIDHGTLRCSPPRSILFDTTNGYEYGLNPPAQSDGYAPPDAIRTSRGAPLTDVVKRGLKLCHG